MPLYVFWSVVAKFMKDGYSKDEAIKMTKELFELAKQV